MAGKGRPGLPWLLLLVAVTAVLPSDADYTEADITSIVQKHIMRDPQLSGFPRTASHPKGAQYGVMILVSQRDYANGNTDIQLSPTPNQNNIDKDYTVQPSLQVAVNYLVARPDSPDARPPREHAEKKLLDNLRVLLRNFAQQNGAPGMIILHTWATPCPACTKELLAMNDYIRQFYPQTRVTVTYTVDREWRNSGMTLAENKENRQKLREAGLTVLQVNRPPTGGSGGRPGTRGGRPGTGGGRPGTGGGRPGTGGGRPGTRGGRPGTRGGRPGTGGGRPGTRGGRPGTRGGRPGTRGGRPGTGGGRPGTGGGRPGTRGGGFGTGGGPFGRGGQTRPYSTTSLLPNTNFRPLGTQTGWNSLRNPWTPGSNENNMQRLTSKPMLPPARNANNVLRRWRVRIPRG